LHGTAATNSGAGAFKLTEVGVGGIVAVDVAVGIGIIVAVAVGIGVVVETGSPLVDTDVAVVRSAGTVISGVVLSVAVSELGIEQAVK
jgi:hypothetical protein